LATHKRLFLVLFEVDGLRSDKSAKVFLRFYAIAVYFDAKTMVHQWDGPAVLLPQCRLWMVVSTGRRNTLS